MNREVFLSILAMDSRFRGNDRLGETQPLPSSS